MLSSRKTEESWDEASEGIHFVLVSEALRVVAVAQTILVFLVKRDVPQGGNRHHLPVTVSKHASHHCYLCEPCSLACRCIYHTFA